jgi:hypothetical protein
MGAPVQIPKTVSSPADPNEHSLLTSLLPELRNTIYALLLKRDESVMLHNAEAYYPQLPERSAYGCDSAYVPDTKRFDIAFDKCMGGASEFAHDFKETTPLFLVCCQIYHESIGVLYGLNTFTFSRALHQHDLDAVDYVTTYFEDQYDPLIFAPKWLSNLGSQSSLLRKVYIDTDVLCPSYCYTGRMYVDVLPLTKYLWNQPGLLQCLSFTNAGRISSLHMDAINKEFMATGRTIDRTRQLRDMVKAIISNDELNLKATCTLAPFVSEPANKFVFSDHQNAFRGCTSSYVPSHGG